MFNIETANNSDHFFDYCLNKYIPEKDFLNKYISSNLFFHSIYSSQYSENLSKFTTALREKIGRNKTVWGVKNINSKISWEFYFYNQHKNNPQVLASEILPILERFFQCPISIDETNPYFMFSFNISDISIKTKAIGELNLYVTDLQNDIPAGISYTYSSQGKKLGNHYRFYDPITQKKLLTEDLLKSEPFLNNSISIEEILLPELINCNKICLAEKQNVNSIYFSGIVIDSFTSFLKAFNYNIQTINFLKDNYNHLDHLKFDVGYDYTIKDNKIQIVKSSYYGTF